MNKPDKIRLRARGPYVVADMPEGAGSFVVEELVAELRRSRPKTTLTAISGEYGESERNFRRYLKGKPMPLAKGQRFARRLRDLHFSALAPLARLSQSHPRGREATEILQKARDAFQEGYAGLSGALEERGDILRAERAALVLKRTQPDAEDLAHHAERMRSRYERMILELARSRNLSVREWPPPYKLSDSLALDRRIPTTKQNPTVGRFKDQVPFLPTPPQLRSTFLANFRRWCSSQ